MQIGMVYFLLQLLLNIKLSEMKRFRHTHVYYALIDMILVYETKPNTE